MHRFAVFSRFPANSAVSSVKIPQTARKYREQAVHEAVVTGDFESLSVSFQNEVGMDIIQLLFISKCHFGRHIKEQLTVAVIHAGQRFCNAS
jgi:hypothetical protein